MSRNRPPSPQCAETALCAVVFPTELGWMAMITRGPMVLQLTIGLRSRAAALSALDSRLPAGAEPVPLAPQMTQSALPAEAEQGPLLVETEDGRCRVTLIDRLRAYAAGRPVNFLDVAVALGPLSDFRRRIVRCCRRIPYGKTATYGQLARLAGSPNAARAVGQVMAANRVPIIVPCHRVVAAGGSLGGFSAPGGVELKRRLLELEAEALNNLRAR